MSNGHSNMYPKLHNAAWPGVVGKGSPGAEPFIDLDTMLDLTAACPVPVLVAGGPAMPTEEDVLAYVRDALAGGAGGVAMGRNIFQAADPRRLAAKVARLIHHFPEQHFGAVAFPTGAGVHRDERLTPDHLDDPAPLAASGAFPENTHHLSDLSHPTGGPHHDGRKTVLA